MSILIIWIIGVLIGYFIILPTIGDALDGKHHSAILFWPVSLIILLFQKDSNIEEDSDDIFKKK